jgi:glycosyltransferase involved in cell wall biosynthesis
MRYPTGIMRRHLAIAGWFAGRGTEVRLAFGMRLSTGQQCKSGGAEAGSLPPGVVEYPDSESATAGGWRPDLIVCGWGWWVANDMSALNALGSPARLFLLTTGGDAGVAVRAAAQGWIVAPISRHMARDYERQGGRSERMRPILNGVDLEQFRPPPEGYQPERRSTILWRCREHRDASHAAAVPAEYVLHRALIRVGLGEHLRHLSYDDLATRLPADRAHEAYNDARFVVLNETRRAGGCNTILEAAACGVPVVARDVPATREMAEDGGPVWLAEHAEALATGAKEYYENHGGLREKSKQGIAWARRQGWPSYCEALEQFVLDHINAKG